MIEALKSLVVEFEPDSLICSEPFVVTPSCELDIINDVPVFVGLALSGSDALVKS